MLPPTCADHGKRTLLAFWQTLTIAASEDAGKLSTMREGDSLKSTLSVEQDAEVSGSATSAPMRVTIQRRKTAFSQRHRQPAVGTVVGRSEQASFRRFETDVLHGQLGL